MDEGIGGFSALSKLKIGIVGLGLIGGSLAKAFKAKSYKVCGFDLDEETVKKAIKESAVDEAYTSPEAVMDCDVVFVALYPEGIINFVRNNAESFKKGSVVADCCGIKGEVCRELYKENYTDFHFVGAHPMAGTEQSGFSASFPSLFAGASFIIAPRENEKTEIVEMLKKLMLSVGFGRVVVTTPENHDRMIAFTSQIPHVLACSYVLSPRCENHKGFSAGSYRDVSRVAHINPELWAQLFIDNRKALCEEIDTLVENIEAIRNAAENCDSEKLSKLLLKARTAKDSADKKD